MIQFFWCLFWHADIFNLYSGLFFHKWSKSQKILLIRIFEILLPLTNNNPNRHQTRHATSDSSIPSLSSFSPLHFFPPSLHSLHWLDFVTQEIWSSTGDYTYGCHHQKTTCILARQVSDCDRPWWIISYAAISNSLSDYPCILYPVLSFQFISHHPHQQTILDLFQPKMSPKVSFSGMYRKPFIRRRNRTNSQ